MTAKFRPAADRRWASFVAPLALMIGLASGCGASNPSADAANETEVVIEADPEAEAERDASSEPEPTVPPSTVAATDESNEPNDLGGLPSALPIAEAFETAAPIFGTTGTDSAFLASVGSTLSVIRDGSVAHVPLTDGLLQFDTMFLTSAGRYAIVHGFEYGWGNNGGRINAAVSVDLETLEVVGRSQDPGVVMASMPHTGHESQTLAWIDGQTGVLDARTLDFGPPFDTLNRFAGFSASTYLLDGELWTLMGDGSIEVVDPVTGTSIRQGSLDRHVGALQALFMGHDANSIWISSSIDGTIEVLDRATADVIATTNVNDAFPDASITITASAGTFLLLDVQYADTSWYVLAQVDIHSGEIVARHLVAPSTNDRWPGGINRATFDLVGDDVYVTDHMRRVVRVDMDRWGDDTGEWVDPELSITREFDGEEADVGDIALAWINGESSEVQRTDLELSLASRPTTGSRNLGEVTVSSVDIHGDRAFVVLETSLLGVIPTLAMERVEGGWAINSTSECWLLAQVDPTLECPAHD